MSLDTAVQKPHERLATTLAADLEAVNHLIRARMASEHAPRIPEVTAHLVEAGGKRVRPMLTLACARMFGYEGELNRWRKRVPLKASQPTLFAPDTSAPKWCAQSLRKC